MEGSLESWHQTLPRSSKPAHTTDIYNWGDINSLFEDQVQVEKSKVNNLRRLKKPKLKRLSKRLKASVFTALSQTKKTSGKDMKLTLGKHGITAKRLLQKTPLMKAQRGATNTQK